MRVCLESVSSAETLRAKQSHIIIDMTSVKAIIVGRRHRWRSIIGEVEVNATTLNVVNRQTVNKLEKFSSESSISKNITSSQINDLAERINKLIMAFNNLVVNPKFNELASFDEDIADFCSSSGELATITQILYSHHAWSLSFSTLLYSNENGEGVSGAPESKMQVVAKQQIDKMLEDLDTYMAMFSSLQNNDFYFNEISYGQIRSDCFGNKGCLSNVDKDLSREIDNTKAFCLQII